MGKSYLACCFILASLVLLWRQASAQGKEYLDENWHHLDDSTHATYYRIQWPEAGGTYIKDFYMETHQLQMEGLCSTLKPEPVIEGEIKFYYKSGRLLKIGNYLDGRPYGTLSCFYEDGSPLYQQVCDGDTCKFAQYWTPEGKRVLDEMGNGKVDLEQDNPNRLNSLEFSDSLMTASFLKRLDLGDSIYLFLPSDKATFPGGIEKFYQGISNTLVYPKRARRTNIEGRVYIRFIIDKEGRLGEAWVVKGIGAGCDEEALRAVQEVGSRVWQPAHFHGKPVKMLMTLPIVFKLTG